MYTVDAERRLGNHIVETIGDDLVDTHSSSTLLFFRMLNEYATPKRSMRQFRS